MRYAAFLLAASVLLTDSGHCSPLHPALVRRMEKPVQQAESDTVVLNGKRYLWTVEDTMCLYRYTDRSMVVRATGRPLEAQQNEKMEAEEFPAGSLASVLKLAPNLYGTYPEFDFFQTLFDTVGYPDQDRDNEPSTSKWPKGVIKAYDTVVTDHSLPFLPGHDMKRFSVTEVALTSLDDVVAPVKTNMCPQALLFSEDELRWIFKPIMQGLVLLHKNGIAHRDIKPENILINEEGNPRLADFDLAYIQGNGDMSLRSGTPGYAPPEYIDANFYNLDPFASDVFALQISMRETALGIYWAKHLSELVHHEQDRDRVFVYDDFEQCRGMFSDEWNQMLDKMRADLQSRITMEQVANEPWWNGDETVVVLQTAEKQEHTELCTESWLGRNEHRHSTDSDRRGSLTNILASSEDSKKPHSNPSCSVQ